MKTTLSTAKLFLALALMIFMNSSAHAILSSYLVSSNTGQLVNAPAKYETKSIKVSINPGATNWIAWSRLDHLATYNGQKVIDGPIDPNLGVDDYFTLTITDPHGLKSSAITMDMNDGNGNPQGQQAMIFGSSSAPDVMRANVLSSGQPVLLNESGIANSIFQSGGAGLYTLTFDFWNQWNVFSGHPDVYLLVDTNVVPEPATLALSALGLAGLALARRRFRRPVAA